MATVLTKGFIQLCTVGSGIILARMLGPAGRGVFGAAILWPVLFTYIGLFGLSEAIARAAAREKQTGPLARTALLLGLGIASLTLLVGYVLLPHLIPAGKIETVLPLAILALLFIPVEQSVLIFSGIAQGTGNFRILNVCLGLRPLLYVSLLFAVWMKGFESIPWCIFALVLPGTVVTAVYLVQWAPSIITARGWYSPTKLLSGTWQFGIAIAGREIYQVVDKALLLWLVTESEMGYYLAGLAAASVVCNLISGVGTVGFTECAKSPPRRGFPLVANLFRKAMVLWLLVGGALGLAMPILLPLVYGSRFAPAVPISIILLLGVGAFGITNMLNLCMFGKGQPLLSLPGRVAGTVLMASTGFLLARFEAGAIGIAIANVAGQWCCMLSLAYLVCRYYEDRDPSLLVPKWADVTAMARLVPQACRRFFPLRNPASDDDSE